MNKITLFEKQKEIAKLLQVDSGKNYICIAGSTGSGKTDGVINVLIAQALRYNGIKIGVFRKNYTTLRSTTIPSFIECFSRANLWKYINYNQRDNTMTLPNGSQFLFKEADITKDPDLMKIKGLQLTYAVMEEANEMSQKVFSILVTRIGRAKNKDYGIAGKIILTLNPSYGWVKKEFYEKFRAGTLGDDYAFMEMTALDNPYLPKSFIEGLELLPDEEKQRYLHNNWEYDENVNSLIPYEWLKNCIKDEEYLPQRSNGEYEYKMMMLGVDPSREGNDRTILAISNGWSTYKWIEVTKQDNVEVAELVRDTMEQYSIGTDNVWVDTIGIGAGVYDVLYHNGYEVNSYKGSDSAYHWRGITAYRFGNKRAESYWIFRELIKEGEYSLVYNEQLIKELTNINWFRKDGKIYIESKADIKKRLGYSPDYADATVIGISSLIRARADQRKGLELIY